MRKYYSLFFLLYIFGGGVMPYITGMSVDVPEHLAEYLIKEPDVIPS